MTTCDSCETENELCPWFSLGGMAAVELMQVPDERLLAYDYAEVEKQGSDRSLVACAGQTRAELKARIAMVAGLEAIATRCLCTSKRVG